MLAVLALLPAIRAQRVEVAVDPERRAAVLFVFEEQGVPKVAVSIAYTPAVWRDGYDEMLANPTGRYQRLGKGWWTTFDTIAPMEIGGTRVEAGSYYLGLRIGDDGSFRLQLFASAEAMKAGLMPWTTALYRGEVEAQYRVPMTLAKDSLKQAAVEFEIAITADAKDATRGALALRWGKHELSAPVRFLPAAPVVRESGRR
jgi:hypothetical protein